jgi:glucokinase
MKVLGIDIGGTNTEMAVMSQKDGLIDSISFQTSSVSSFSEYIDKLTESARLLLMNHEVASIGIGAPNYDSRRNEFSPVNFVWEDVKPFNLQSHFESQFIIPCSVVNDANALALAENRYGVGKVYSSFVMLTLGTGLGCGIILNNQLFDGSSGYAGEFGHVKVDGLDRACNCGGCGCLETVVSANGIMSTYIGVKESYNGLPLHSVKEVFDRASLKDEACLNVLDTTFSHLGKKLSDLIHILNPEAIIFSGNISKSLKPFMDQISSVCEESLMTDFKNLSEYRVSDLIDEKVNLLGPCSLAFEQLENMYETSKI